MTDILAPLNDSQYIAKQAFKMHCESLAMGVALYYKHNGITKEVTDFEELSHDFPQLSTTFKNDIISSYQLESTL